MLSETSKYICSYNFNTTIFLCVLLKVVIRESHLDTNETASQIRIQLITLDDFMATCGHDISKINRIGRILLDSLKDMGEKKIFPN